MATVQIDDISVLIVDDNKEELNAINKALIQYGFNEEKITPLQVKLEAELHEKIKDEYKKYDLLFFDLKFEESVEEGLNQLEKLIISSEGIFLTAVYVITTTPKAALTRQKVKALILDAIAKPKDTDDPSAYIFEFERKEIKETIVPVVDTYRQIKERIKIYDEISRLANKVDTIYDASEKILEKVDKIDIKIDLLSSSTRAILSLLPDTMDESKKKKAQFFIENEIENIEFPDSLKRDGILGIVKTIVIDSAKEGIKEGSMSIIKEKLGDELKQTLINKAKEEGMDTDDAVYAGLYFARNTVTALAKTIGINLEA